MVVITAHSSIEGAIDAMRSEMGALRASARERAVQLFQSDDSRALRRIVDVDLLALDNKFRLGPFALVCIRFRRCLLFLGGQPFLELLRRSRS